MEIIYYVSGILLTLVLIITVFSTIYFTAKPQAMVDGKNFTKPPSRKQILLTGLCAIIISLFGFGSVMAATAPPSAEERRSAEAQAKESENAKAEESRKREAAAKKPMVKTKSTTSPIPFESREEPDPALPQGQTRVAVEGVDGLKTITYKITYVQGKETNREKLKSEITHAPTTKIIKVGTYIAPPPSPAPVPAPAPQAQTNVYYRNCSAARAAGAAPVYAGEPGYASHLDRDNDGVGCE